MKIMDFRFVVRTGFAGAIGKYSPQTIHRLALPRAHLVRMHLVPAGISWIVLSPRSASSATLALKSAVNRRRVVISAFLR